jgi:hypothetical protein
VLTVSDEQRQAIEDSGAPLALLDAQSGRPFMLLAVELSPASIDGVRAEIKGIRAFGEGTSPDEALIALQEALRAILQ